MHMEIEEQLINMGLTEYESKVIISIIKHGEASAKRISIDSGVPYSRIYDTLNDLLKKDWIRKKEGRPSLYCQGDLTEKINEYIDEKKLMAEKLKTNIVKLSENNRYELSPTINVERGWSNFFRKIEELRDVSKKLTCVFGFYDSNAFDKINIIFKNKFYAKNLFVKNDLLTQDFINELEKMSSVFQIKILPFTPRALLFLFDGKNIVIVLPSPNDSNEDEIKILEIRNFEIGELLEKMIEIALEESLPFESFNVKAK